MYEVLTSMINYAGKVTDEVHFLMRVGRCYWFGSVVLMYYFELHLENPGGEGGKRGDLFIYTYDTHPLFFSLFEFKHKYLLNSAFPAPVFVVVVARDERYPQTRVEIDFGGDRKSPQSNTISCDLGLHSMYVNRSLPTAYYSTPLTIRDTAVGHGAFGVGHTHTVRLTSIE